MRVCKVRSPKMKKQKCAQSSKGSLELTKHLKDKEEETDENAPTSKCDWHNRSHRRSVAMASEVEEVGINNDIVKLLSVNTRHGSKSEDVSSYSTILVL